MSFNNCWKLNPEKIVIEVIVASSSGDERMFVCDVQRDNILKRDVFYLTKNEIAAMGFRDRTAANDMLKKLRTSSNMDKCLDSQIRTIYIPTD